MSSFAIHEPDSRSSTPLDLVQSIKTLVEPALPLEDLEGFGQKQQQQQQHGGGSQTLVRKLTHPRLASREAGATRETLVLTSGRRAS